MKIRRKMDNRHLRVRILPQNNLDLTDFCRNNSSLLWSVSNSMNVVADEEVFMRHNAED